MKKQYRVRKNQEFQKIISSKKFRASKHFVLYFRERRQDHARVGISVSKKLGNAVMRNKVKRQVRMMLMDCFDTMGKTDVIVIVRPAYHSLSFADNKKDLETLLKKGRI